MGVMEMGMDGEGGDGGWGVDEGGDDGDGG